MNGWMHRQTDGQMDDGSVTQMDAYMIDRMNVYITTR